MKKFFIFSIRFIVIIISLIVLTILTLWIYYYRVSHEKTGKMKVTYHPGIYGQYVNTFIGTAGYPWVCGHNFPGAACPFGVVRLSPDSWSTVFRAKALNTSGYYFNDNRIVGFSHTRLSGTGATDGGHFRVIPATGKDPWKTYCEGNYLPFSHCDETAFPGYYAVNLRNAEIFAEFTSTQRTGIHRYTFTKNVHPHLLLDVSSVLGDKKSKEGRIDINPATGDISGEVHTYGTFSGRHGGVKVYFFARFDKPFTVVGLWNGKDLLPNLYNGSGDQLGTDFLFNSADATKNIVLRLAISHVSVENARENLEVETNGKSFDEILNDAVNNWEDKLSLIQIGNTSEKQKTIFYTALYRSFLMPTIFQDVNGQYTGFDKQVHQAVGFNYYTDLSLWDTFRTLHPLYTLIAPNEQRDMLVSLVKMKEQGGWLPRWPSGCGYTGSMLGSPADIVIAESYVKGIRDFDVASAYQGMKQIALAPTPEGSPFSGRKGIAEYLIFKYCPSDLMEQSVSRTIEFGWADRAIALLADSLGYQEDAKLFHEHSQYFKNTWNPATRFFQPRDSKGNFFQPFKPLLLTYTDFGGKYTNDYVEGSAWQWRFSPFFDSKGLIELFGGKEKFTEELSRFFEKADPAYSSWYPGSYYWHGNEPDIHSAFLFNSADRPDLTQKWVRWILENKYDTTPDGIDGNDDGATLSSWYIFASLGLYPIAGSDCYELCVPSFQKASILLGKNILQIITENYSPKNQFVSKIWLNGKLLSDFKLKHKDISEGGILKFEMKQ